MVSAAFQIQPFFNRPALGLDTSSRHKFEDDDGILDDNILDHTGLDSGLEMSPPMADSRRDSFAVGASMFSPKSEDWSQAVEMQSVPSNNPFFDSSHSNNPFMRMDQAQAAVYGTQNGAWSMGNSSGACTPLQAFADYDGLPSVPRPVQNPFAGPPSQLNMFSSAISPVGQQSSSSSSPQKAGWMDQVHVVNKKNTGSVTSPMIRSHNEMRRGDGIRKKNARFDIPAERNLSNIDHLISQSTDEQTIKELKQQKRLLRNRQAALDSRQRKKQHTERLEDEKKQYTQIMGDMEENMNGMRIKMEQLLREKATMMEYLDMVNQDKEEMIRAHTIETGELRKKVSVLTEHVQRLEGAAAMSGGMPAAAASHYHGGYDEMDAIPTMGGCWDNVPFVNDFAAEPEIKQEPQTQLVPVKKTDVSFPAEVVDKPTAQGGLLFMLFLVGAFVMSSRSTPPIPRVSEDVRVASATILENVLKDAGVGPAAVGPAAPQPSGSAWTAMPTIGQPEVRIDGGILGDLGDTLTQPTQEQQNEQLFGLSAARYNGINSKDFLQNAPERSTSQGRRNLADALSAVRNGNKQTGAADVYTRSLLWDQIPSQVVRDFAKMMSECNGNSQDEQQQQQQQQQCNDGIST